ncbi:MULTISPECIES: vWA domain-containing protein [unclassified Luteococcus]|uniref:vWA domain-containing protein n=1 Tax=unclassified Luteococcus TaxID=2639923 RepID=UPI00313DC0B8
MKVPMVKVTTLAALATAGLLATPVLAHADDATDAKDAKILLMLDASGSMNQKDPSGLTKIEAAKKALTATVGSIPEQSQVGLRVYGATVNTPKPTKQSCTDTQLVHPVAAVDKPGLVKAIGSFKAVGDTPIAYSLGQAAKDLGTDGKRHIILVSDGEESCSADPCAEVKKLVGLGIDLQVDTVGFAVNQTARRQLQCIAQASNGSYYDAKDAGALQSSLSKLSTRAARSFTLSGKPVTGTAAPQEAPLVAPGQYVDRMPTSPSATVKRHYRLQRTIPGSSMRFSVLGRPPMLSNAYESIDAPKMTTRMLLPTGAVCSMTTSTWLESGVAMTLTGQAYADPQDPKAQFPTEESKACAEATEMYAELTYPAVKFGQIPIEIRVAEEASPLDLASLPDGAKELPERNSKPSPAKGTPVKVDGGAGFSNATPVQPGTYQTNVVPGETVYFKVPVAYGQSLRHALDGIDVLGRPQFQEMTNLDVLTIRQTTFAPDGTPFTPGFDNRLVIEANGQPSKFYRPVAVTPAVNYRNRWDTPAPSGGGRGFALAGDYYVAVSVERSPRSAQFDGTDIPVRFSIAVDGEAAEPPATGPRPTASDASHTPSDTPEASASSTPEDTSSQTASQEPTQPTDDGSKGDPKAIGGAMLVLAALAGGGAYLVRRRR